MLTSTGQYGLSTDFVKIDVLLSPVFWEHWWHASSFRTLLSPHLGGMTESSQVPSLWGWGDVACTQSAG